MSTPRRLDGRVALVTGASRGIGRAIAVRLHQEGARIAACSTDEKKLTGALAGLDALCVGCDVAKHEEVLRFAATVREKLGVPDIIINNAGYVVRRTLDEMTEADWDRVIDVNLKGTFNVCHAFIADLRQRRSGRIINISSISATLGTPRLIAYCAAKHGVNGFTKALAEELRQFGIQVNALCPGSVDTTMLVGSGFAPKMTANEVAEMVAYLASDAPAATTGSCVEMFG